MSEKVIVLKKGEGWGWRLLTRLPCGHEGEILASWVGPDGRFNGGIGCTEPGCRKRYENVVLEGWKT